MRKLWLSVACAAAVAAAVPAAAADYVKPGCAELENSVLPEPDWYAEECLGGGSPLTGTWQWTPGPWRVPGDLAYVKELRGGAPIPRALATAPLPTFTFTTIGTHPSTLATYAMDFDNAAAVLWAIDTTSRQLGTFDLTTGAFVPVVAVTGITGTITGMKFDPTSSTVYASSATQLFTLDLTTGVATSLPQTFAPFVLIIDIAISNTGQMYGHDIGVDQFVSIDKTTGVATPIGPTTQNANFAQGMDFDASDNTLYAWMYIGSGVNNLSQFNLTTGAATVIVTGPVGPELEGAVRVPAVQFTPLSLAVDAAGNHVMEPAEAATVAPSWRNDSSLGMTAVTGTLTNFAGPAGGTYTIVDGTAAYGDIAAGATATCSTDCYTLTAAAATRPALHWDATVDETLSVPGQSHTWTLHVGGSFTDMPPTSPFYRFVETLLHTSVTGGCGTDTYCPTASTTREQMAVFVLVAKEGAGYTPIPCAPPHLFGDVDPASPFCRFIEELAERDVVTGCGPNLYCPSAPVTREQMAIFALRTLDPTLNPPACVAGGEMFTDVPASSPFCRWVEELARRGVVSGCGTGLYCPSDPVTREQMGVFLSVTFGLTLYGV